MFAIETKCYLYKISYAYIYLNQIAGICNAHNWYNILEKKNIKIHKLSYFINYNYNSLIYWILHW